MFFDRKRRKIFEEEALPHMEALYRSALGMIRNPSSAEDLLQETYQQAWASFHRYQPGTDCKAWLFRILFRLRSKQLRRSGQFQWTELDEVPEEKLATPPEVLRKLEGAQVLKVIDSLPEHYRDILILADAEQFSYHEISRILDLPIGTVMSRLNRGRQLFRLKFFQAKGQQQSA